MPEMTENLYALPTETLQSLATLTRDLRVKQYLRALTPDMLRALALECSRKQNSMLSNLVQTELDARS